MSRVRAARQRETVKASIPSRAQLKGSIPRHAPLECLFSGPRRDSVYLNTTCQTPPLGYGRKCGRTRNRPAVAAGDPGARRGRERRGVRDTGHRSQSGDYICHGKVGFGYRGIMVAYSSKGGRLTVHQSCKVCRTVFAPVSRRIFRNTSSFANDSAPSTPPGAGGGARLRTQRTAERHT